MAYHDSMRYFLAKTSRETYSIDKLEQEMKPFWDGVTNAQAVRAIREMRPGDHVFIYHSMGSSAVVGLAKVLTDPVTDPRNARSAVVELQFLGRLEPPTTRAEIKQSKKFEDWALGRHIRVT